MDFSLWYQDLKWAVPFLPLSQITRLTLQGLDCGLHAANNLLAFCAALESCSIQAERLDPDSDSVDLGRLSMSCLVSFSLCEKYPTNIAKPFFEKMDTLRLEYLDCHCWAQSYTPWIHLLTTIQNLVVHIHDTTEKTFLDFIQSNKSLRRLRADQTPRGSPASGMYTEDRLLARLMPDSERLLCPRLETFEMLAPQRSFDSTTSWKPDPLSRVTMESCISNDRDSPSRVPSILKSLKSWNL
ncbi:hypothetical protein C8J56DRAFT_1123567 [Mycena floridula]|nr:hypothetical protein C8J56DRAFT_1123567 [Mycena floridula]